MDNPLARYYELKETQKLIEEELNLLRNELLEAYAEAGKAEAGEYQLTINHQERREYNDDKVFNALPDASLWRLMSRADTGKIASLLKLNVVQEQWLTGTYELRKVPVLRVQKR
ncbi:hypothetical protein [Brevibacillus sp. AY1]|uniref:hypothetical protein n=1 Tax=Brevibacillus sp. AY1 TaxID=2807621 RepID=UPI0024582036|nr:hypothetical protein [Brevibacillus sp. AY1]MDH4618527.1 hypothetical protein [Brevibacillus sp. AY1]